MNDWPSRRGMVVLAGARFRTLAAAQQEREPRPVDADQALSDLLAGNQWFTAGKPLTPRLMPAEFRSLAHGQFPEAVIVSCANSRVAPEILSDVGVGDIFVVRVAGNVINGTGVAVKGSIEYANRRIERAPHPGSGHSGCGAVKAALKHIDDKDSILGSINGLVELIKPAVARAKGMPGDPLENAIRQNVEIGVERLRELEPILAPRVRDGRVKVAGGVYDLSTGAVTILGKER